MDKVTGIFFSKFLFNEWQKKKCMLEMAEKNVCWKWQKKMYAGNIYGLNEVRRLCNPFQSEKGIFTNHLIGQKPNQMLFSK